MRRLVYSGFGFAVLAFIFSCAHKAADKKAAELPVLKLETVQELKLKSPLEKGRGAYVSAASGIITVGDTFYVISDDEQFIFSFKKGDRFLKPNAALPGQLEEAKDRKAAKADFESLAYLASDVWPPYGAIVAWPSGSGLKRMRAVAVPFDKKGVLGKPQVTEILPLAYQLQKETDDLNMEGVLVREKKVYLFQRGNAGKGKNAIIEVPLESWLKGLRGGDWAGKIKYEKIKIGKLSGVNLTFSDVAWTKYGLLALVSAEDSASSYADGAVYGSALVRVVGDRAEILGRFDPVAKLEGITAHEAAGGLDLYLVDDADTAEKPSRLYKVHVSDSLLSSIK